MPAGTLRVLMSTLLIVISLVGLLGILSVSIDLRGAWSLLRSCKDSGIRRIHCSGRGTSELSEHVASAREIRIMAVSGQALIKLHKPEKIVSALSKNATLQVLLASPHSEFLRDVEDSEGPSRSGQISPEIDQVWRLLAEYLTEATSKAGLGRQVGEVHIGYHSTLLRSSLILCDRDWGWLTLNLPPIRAVQSTSFELIEKPGSLLANCQKHFDRSYEIAKSRNSVRSVAPA
jgi:hypothetical protein